MTHLHPAVLSPSSPLPRPMDFAFDASSSSTISCGLIVMCTTFDVSGLNLHAFKGSLSSNSLPKNINRILLGLLGFVSHSSLHSLNINSLSVYTLIVRGSFFPFSVTPGTATERLVKYFSSILYGWRAPDVSSKVIKSLGPPSVGGGGVLVISREGPIASEFIRGREVDDS